MIGYAALAATERKMEKTIIDQMVDRFLCWQLPEDFAPDGGIKFTPPHLNDDKALHWPTGTCLLTAPQAKAMFEHCADGTAITDADEDAYVIDMLGRLLAEIAVIVNGPEPPLTRWSYHDLPDKVRALKAAAMAERERCIGAIPKGMVVVPKLPTKQMYEDGRDAVRIAIDAGDSPMAIASDAFDAMIAAAHAAMAPTPDNDR